MIYDHCVSLCIHMCACVCVCVGVEYSALSGQIHLISPNKNSKHHNSISEYNNTEHVNLVLKSSKANRQKTCLFHPYCGCKFLQRNFRVFSRNMFMFKFHECWVCSVHAHYNDGKHMEMLWVYVIVRMIWNQNKLLVIFVLPATIHNFLVLQKLWSENVYLEFCTLMSLDVKFHLSPNSILSGGLCYFFVSIISACGCDTM